MIDILATQKDKRNHDIDFLRFLFSVIIVYYHIVKSLAEQYGMRYEKWAAWSVDANLIVDCFLIIGGYFLLKGYERKREPIFVFVIKRIIRLWPAFFVACIASFVLQPSRNILYDLFFLRSTGLTLENGGILWYVGPYFWCGIFLFLLFHATEFNRPLRYVLLMGFVYLGYVININYTNGTMDRIVVYGMFSLSICRIMAGLSVGCICYIVSKKILEVYTMRENKYLKIFRGGVLLVLKVILVGYMIGPLPKAELKLFVVVFFGIYMILSAVHYTVYEEEKTKIASWGSFSYSIYVMQNATILMLDKTLWKTNLARTSEMLTIIISVISCLMVGILVYWFVEKRVLKLQRRIK